MSRLNRVGDHRLIIQDHTIADRSDSYNRYIPLDYF